MNSNGDRVPFSLCGSLRGSVIPVALLVASTLPALAAPGSGPASAHLHSAAMQAAAGDVVLGAGAATAILAGMVVVLAASWRGFREMLKVGGEDDGPPDLGPWPRRPGDPDA